MNIFDADSAPLLECRDFIAEAMGWKDDMYGLHPISSTLDGVVSCLPSGWKWHRISYRDNYNPIVHVSAVSGRHIFDPKRQTVESADDSEILARFRVACKAWLISQKEGEAP